MSDRERMEERVFVFTDADKRARLTAEELASCPTVEEVMEAMAV